MKIGFSVDAVLIACKEQKGVKDPTKSYYRLSIEENDATRAINIDDVSETSNCESDLDCAGSIKMEHGTKPKSRPHRNARPLEEMLSEVIDTYLTLGRKQRQEIAVLLYQITEEKEKETQK